MDPSDLDDDDAQALADQIGPHLEPGQYGDRVVLSRRQAIGLGTGALGAGALLALGVDPAVAQAAGSQGTPEEPNDMYAYDLNVANAVTSALPMNGHAIENAGSVSTANAPDADDEVLRWQEGVEQGELAVSGLDNSAGNNDWGQAASKTVSVTFDGAFNTSPDIACVRDVDIGTLGAIDWDFEILNKSSTGFDIEVYQMRAKDRSGVGTAYGISWLATPGR